MSFSSFPSEQNKRKTKISYISQLFHSFPIFYPSLFYLYIYELVSRLKVSTDKKSKYKDQDKCQTIISILKAILLGTCRQNSNLIQQRNILQTELTRTQYRTTN